MFAEADAMHASMVVAETKARSGGDLPMEKGFITLDNESLTFSGIKQASRSDALILRLFNATGVEQVGNLTFAAPVNAAFLVDLNEELAPGSLECLDNVVTIPVGAKKIVTLAVRLSPM